MITRYLAIEKIIQKDNYHFLIKWTDGTYQEFKLSHLQRLCTCVKCYDKDKDITLVCPEEIDENVKAFRIYSIGRYALKIDFEKGCSRGIYTYQFLRQNYEAK